MSKHRYIVTNGLPMELTTAFNDGPVGGVLCYGNKATVFKTRKAAQAAVDRSAAYAREKQLPWDVVDKPWDTIIIPLDLSLVGGDL